MFNAKLGNGGMFKLALVLIRRFRSGISTLHNPDHVEQAVENFMRLYQALDCRKYDFNQADIDLYVGERSTYLHPLQVVRAEADYSLLRINDLSFYWPQNMSSDDLPWLYHEVFDDWAKNPSSYNHPQLDLTAVGWVIDAGAFEGFYSLFARLNGFKGKLIAVEPLGSLCHVLKMNFNGSTIGSYAVITKALGSRAGYCYINQDNAHACDSYVSNIMAESAKQCLHVEQTTIDNLVKDHCLSGRGLIKMDIEGYEMEALRGAEHVIKTLKPQLAIAVYHGYDNARECEHIVKSIRDDYTIEFRGMYGYFNPPRPYLMFAY